MSKPLAAGIASRSTSYTAHPSNITRREGFNPRFDFGEIAELAKSIKANGVLNPLRVKRIPERDGKNFELIDGDRRLTALELLMEQGEQFADGVPIILVDKDQDDVTSLVQMFEANTGKAFLPLEKAAAFKRLRDAGLTIKEICARVGVSDVDVIDTLKLLEADDSLREAVQSGKVGVTAAKQIAHAAKGDKAKQKELTAAAAAAGTDKAKRRAFQESVRKVHEQRAAAKGKSLKVRVLDAHQLGELGARVAKMLEAKWGIIGTATHEERLDIVKKDDALVAAFTLGALEALKAAAGMKVDLDL